MTIQGLDTVDWKSLYTPTQSAETIPFLLAAIDSGDENARRAALAELSDNVYHQGDIGKVTVYVVPFLYKFLSQPDFTEKEGILELLERLAESSAKTLRRIEEKSVQSNLFASSTHQQPRHTSTYASEVHQAIRNGVEIYMTLLESDNALIRQRAVHVLALLPDEAEHAILKIIDTAQSETNSNLQALMIWHIGNMLEQRLSTNRTEYIDKYTALYISLCKNQLSISDLVLSFASAVSLVRILGVLAPHESINVLLQSISLSESYPPLPWHGVATIDAVAALCKLGVKVGSQHLISALDRCVNAEDAHIIAAAILVLVIEKYTEFDWSYETISQLGSDGTWEIEYLGQPKIASNTVLSLEAKAALEAIARNDRYWEIRSNLLELYGFPKDRSELIKFLSSQ